MDALERHEIFEIEVLDNLKRAGFLKPLVFGGGTMLRLCHEMNRHSADLDFWLIKETATKEYFKELKAHLLQVYELTDAASKRHTLLCEIRARQYPRRLKIEIRKDSRECDFQDQIAYSRFSNKQVILRVHTLEQAMQNKIKAALGRKEIRDCFDIEFLLRKGIPLQATPQQQQALAQVAGSFKKRDFKVTLGSVLDSQTRAYYVENGFSFLVGKAGQ